MFKVWATILPKEVRADYTESEFELSVKELVKVFQEKRKYVLFFNIYIFIGV